VADVTAGHPVGEILPAELGGGGTRTTPSFMQASTDSHSGATLGCMSRSRSPRGSRSGFCGGYLGVSRSVRSGERSVRLSASRARTHQRYSPGGNVRATGGDAEVSALTAEAATAPVLSSSSS